MLLTTEKREGVPLGAGEKGKGISSVSSPSCSHGPHRWILEGQDRRKAVGLATPVSPVHLPLVAILVWHHHYHTVEVLMGSFPLF